MINWETNFNHIKQTMTHVFNEHVQVITDFKTGKVALIKMGEKIADYDLEDFNITDYTDMLTRIAIDAQKLHELQEVQG